MTVNTGTVEYSVNGNDISITCRNGSSVDSSTSSKYVSGVTRKTVNKMPPNTISYSDGGYSGTLSRYDYDVKSTVVDYNEISKVFERVYTNERYVYYDQNGNKTGQGEFIKPMGPTSYSINTDGYVGTIPRVGTETSETVTERWPNGNKKTVREYWVGIYRGSLTKYEPIFQDDYTGYYEGYIYGSTTYYYAYNVTINYVTNQSPGINILSPAQNQLFGQNGTSFVPTVMVSDPDGDTLTCKLFIDSETTPRDTKTISNTATAQTISFNSINLSTLSEGDHTMKFTVYDGEVTIQSTVTIGIDKTSPVIGNVTLLSTDKSISISGSATDNIQMHATPYRFAVNSVESQWISSGEHTIANLMPNTLYTASFEARDRAGNISRTDMDIYTKAEIPVLDLTASGETYLILNISDSNPSGTEYLISCGSKYVNGDAVLVDFPEWIALDSRTLTVTGLQHNTEYSFKAKTRNYEGEETEYSVLESRKTLTLPPDTLDFASISQSDITVSWTGVDGADEYEIEADGRIINVGKATSYEHTGLLPQTSHSYRVRVIHSGGTGNWSSIKSCLTLPTPPQSPQITIHTADITEVIIGWSMVTEAEGYDIEVDGTIQDNGTQLSYIHRDLQPDSAHTYRVRARNTGGSSDWSDPVSITTLPNPPAPPVAVSNEKTKSSIKVIWEETPKTDTYHIEVDGEIIDNGDKNYYLHEGLTPLSEHKYRIRGVNPGGTGVWSEYITITTHPDKPGGIPENVMASGNGNSISLTWFMVRHAWTYEVEINADEIVEVSGTEFLHSGIEPGSNYTYRVRAKNISGTGEWSNPVTLSAASGSELSISSVTAIVNMDSIILQWDTVSDECEYEIEANGLFIDNGFNTLFNHTSLEPGTYYDYKIRVKSSGKSGWDTVLTLSTLPIPPEAPVITDSSATGTSVQLWWGPVEEALSYDLEIDGEIISGITDVTYIHDGLTRGDAHEYRVRARTLIDISPWSLALNMSTTNTTYEISCVQGEEFSFSLLASNIQDFNGITFIVTYDAEQLDVVDLCELTPGNEIFNEGYIAGTNLFVRYEPGKIEYTVNSGIVPGTIWTGEITSIVFRAKDTRTVYIDFNEQ